VRFLVIFVRNKCFLSTTPSRSSLEISLLRSKMVQAVYTDWKGIKPELVEKINTKGRYFERFYEKSCGKFLLGDKLTAADLVLYDLFEQLLEITNERFDGLQKLVENVRLHPDVQSFLNSSLSITWPYNNHIGASPIFKCSRSEAEFRSCLALLTFVRPVRRFIRSPEAEPVI